jgi:hypothetical protein
MKDLKMKPEYLEPWQRKFPTKSDLMTAWSSWFDSKTDEWDLFALTLVFKSGGKVPRPERWESEFRNRVLFKIKRVLERNQKNYELAVPYDDFCYYEFEETSIHRISGLRKPHHVHALIPIRKSSVYRFWSSDTEDIKSQLRKDILSIETVGSLLVERIRENKTHDWVRYCLKGKSI